MRGYNSIQFSHRKLRLLLSNGRFHGIGGSGCGGLRTIGHHPSPLEQWRRTSTGGSQMIATSTKTRLSSFSSSSSSSSFSPLLTYTHCRTSPAYTATRRHLTTAPPNNRVIDKYPCIRVCYASQSGTAQLFAMQLVESLQELIAENDDNNKNNNLQVEMMELNELLAKRKGESNVDDSLLSLLLLDGTTTYTNDDGAAAVLYILLASTTGVGECPENGRDFYNYLLAQQKQQQQQQQPKQTTTNSVDFCVFGLGNQVAHAAHYCVVAKRLYQAIEELNVGKPLLPLALGDDGDCIEDDFDKWKEDLLRLLFSSTTTGTSSDTARTTLESTSTGTTNDTTTASTGIKSPVNSTPSDKTTKNEQNEQEPNEQDTHVRVAPCPGSTTGTRRISSKYPMLKLAPATSTHVRLNLLEENEGEGEKTTSAHSWYPANVKKWTVSQNTNLNPDPAANGLRHLILKLDDDDINNNNNVDDNDTNNTLYQAGDHLFLIPRNADAVVEAYLRLVLEDVSPHAVIHGVLPSDDDNNNSEGSAPGQTPTTSSSTAAYPYPTGLTVYETLSHCVDLSAIPSPSMVRFLLQNRKKPVNYREEIAKPRRTALTLLLENRIRISLEDLLFALPPIRGRFYSIASSPLQHPQHIHLVYRPVRYISDRGYLREGLCTSYMANLTEGGAKVVARVNDNPTFRLPTDPKVPIALLAGGCGVAPIRAFLEERMMMKKKKKSKKSDSDGGTCGGANDSVEFGEALLFVGYRNPADAVLSDFVEEALTTGCLSKAFIAYTTGVPDAALITQVIHQQSQAIWDLLQEGGYIYVCGGAQTFGAAVKRELIDLLARHGGHDEDSATAYLQDLAHSGRLCEDLAD